MVLAETLPQVRIVASGALSAGKKNPMDTHANVVPSAYEDIERSLQAAWRGDTSDSNAWHADTPELGQAAVSALIVQYAYGGIVVEGSVGDQKHFWNRINGEDVDLTRSQYSANDELVETAEAPGKSMHHPTLQDRFAVLRDRIVI